MTTPLRRKLVLAASLVALAVPVLSSCGMATDRPNVIADGGYSLSGDMRVLGSRIVATTDGQGYFIATITLNPTYDAVTDPEQVAQQHALTGIESEQGAGSSINPVTGVNKTVDKDGIANLASPSVGGIPVTGSFKAGDVVPVVLTFATGKKVTVETPVVRDCGYNEGAGQTGSPSPSPTETPTTMPGPYDCYYAPLPTWSD